MKRLGMFPEIKLVVSDKDKVIHSLTEDVNEKGFVKSIENFQVTANAIMTKLIQDLGDSGDCDTEEEDESEGEEANVHEPKKRKK